MREFDVSQIRPRLGGLPHLETITWQNLTPPLRGLPGLTVRATRLGGSPHLSCKRDLIKMREYMDWRVTPPKRITSPPWGPPPPRKQALSCQSRDFKIQRRGRQRERPKNKRFNKQNNNFSRASRFFVHFFPDFARPRRENA